MTSQPGKSVDFFCESCYPVCCSWDMTLHHFLSGALATNIFSQALKGPLYGNINEAPG